jgi:hypothetical protein
MISRRRAALAAFLGLATLPCRAAFEQSTVGGRARAMGSAFVALADDASAVSWNPAALATMTSREAGFSHENRFGLGLVGVTSLSLAYPGIGPGGFGFSWLRTSANDASDLEYSEDTYTFGYGIKIWRGSSLGTALNFRQLVSEKKGSGVTMDFSAKVPLWKDWLGAGALWRNAVQTTLRYDSGFKEPFPRQFQGGVFVKLAKTLTATYDAEMAEVGKGGARSHAGLEWAGGHVALRGGAFQSVAKGTDWVYTAGATVKVKALALDYAYEQHFDLGGTQIVSVRLSF